MPVINTDAARRADAVLEDQKRDWHKAYVISCLARKEDRTAAIEQLAVETDRDYANEIRAKAITCFANRKANAEKAMEKTSKKFKQGMAA